ncbi:MAG: imidazoleglycerol-phosphate dehydratase, partial [SAR324 cluster bacterium]|nr:imidazoleglycerol-phosphate dehydratase [SAR324 cluster bacterium]
MSQSRTASIERKTRETLVRVKLNLDGEGTSETNTG